MPARKSILLNRMNLASAQRKKRAEGEAALSPREQLPTQPPAELKGHKIAAAEWKARMRDYRSIDGELVTHFDRTLLLRYCLAVEDFYWLFDLRTGILKSYELANNKLSRLRNTEDLDSYFKLLAQVTTLLARLQGFDARLDGKSKLIHALEQSLYLSPRSRAGAVPPEMPEPKPPDDMETLLDG